MNLSKASEGERVTFPAPSDLVVALERSLPSSLPVGSGTAVFCIGTCFHRREDITDLDVVVDGVHHRSAAFGMPRPDVLALHPEEPRSYRSGFWATVPIEARDRPGVLEVEVAVRTRSGAKLTAPLGRIEVVERRLPPSLTARPEQSGPGLIAICMATFEPDLALFRAQVDSLRSQSDSRWVCLISDDGSSTEHFEQITRVVAGDARFAVSRSEERLGFYRNFERALTMVPAEAGLVALCDQDDRWHPDKLAVLRAELGTAQLVYSDQRLVDAGGRVLRETLWKGRRNNFRNLASMLIANTITGAATLFRRELVETALPFPDTPGYQFHDHWLGLVALATGEIRYVDRPLYDYVQHAGAVFGDVSQGSTPRRRPWARAAPKLRGLSTRWRAAYFYGYLAREVAAQTVLVRCPTGLTARNRRALRRFVASARSPAAFAWLAARPLRGLVGRTETLGSETGLALGILWRWLIVVRARRSRAPMHDACPPPLGSFSQKRLRRWRARL